MDKKDLPKVNTNQVDIVSFAAKRDLFFIEQISFKSGFLGRGVIAVNLLYQMYETLPITRHIVRDKKEKAPTHAEFREMIDAFRRKMITYAKRKGEVKSGNYIEFNDYQELDNEFDGIVDGFFLIMAETGFSP